MKYFYCLLTVLIAGGRSLPAQQKNPAAVPDSIAPLLGYYQAGVNPANRFNIKWEDGQLLLDIPGQGRSNLVLLGRNRFRPIQVQPSCIIQFVEESNGKVSKFQWLQPTHTQWTRVDDSSHQYGDSLSDYTGRFRLKGSAYIFADVRNDTNHLSFQATGEEKLDLVSLGRDTFFFKVNDMQLTFTFTRDKKAAVKKMTVERTGALDFVRVRDSAIASVQPEHISNQQNGFTRADTLRGMLTPLRTCYDVSFYHLDITIRPETKSIDGANLIRFRVINDFDRMQIDLYSNMQVQKILFRGKEMTYSREADAIFIRFPSVLKAGSEEEIVVQYSGAPQVPDLSVPMKGGILWMQNQQDKPWIESVCQGSGASLWWPCKDHLSDKPDSMAISVTVPSDLTDISNGRLLRKTILPNHFTRYDWYVSYPITNYNVVINIGDYTHFSDRYVRSGDTLTLDYYCMPYTQEKAKLLFSCVKPMLQEYEKLFGKYPFEKDGFTVMESLYPMEHQSAVSIGQIDRFHFDSIEMRRLMWHECAHEWWGNSVTCSDIADFWIHEGFATYTEYLDREWLYGKQDALNEINKQHAANKEPITGVYNVNHIHYDIGDLYSKGSLMLNTLRHLINNDPLWFSILRGLQDRFRYQSVTAEDITHYISEKSGTDYGYFFDQYLHQAALPELDIKLKQDKKDLVIEYKWSKTATGFHMPVKITKAKNNFDFIQPTGEWQTTRINNMNTRDFHVATDEFYIDLNIRNR